MASLHHLLLDLTYDSVGKTYYNIAWCQYCTYVIKRRHAEDNWHHSEIHSPSPPLEATTLMLTNGASGLYQVILTSTMCLNYCRSSIRCINASINACQQVFSGKILHRSMMQHYNVVSFDRVIQRWILSLPIYSTAHR